MMFGMIAHALVFGCLAVWFYAIALRSRSRDEAVLFLAGAIASLLVVVTNVAMIMEMAY